MSEKLCIFCKHFDWDSINTGDPNSSYPGCGPEGGAKCWAGHYNEVRPDDAEAVRALLLTAETCPDYEGPIE